MSLLQIIVILKHYLFSSPEGFIMNIDFHIQATSGFSLGVIGELIVNIMWESKSRNFSGADIGTLCGLFIAMALQYFYFIGDGPDVRIFLLTRLRFK